MREEGVFQRVVEAILGAKGLGEKVGLGDVAALAEDHVYGAACVEDEHSGLVRRLRGLHAGGGCGCFRQLRRGVRERRGAAVA